MHWIYIFVASGLEICWIYSLKFIDIKKIRAIEWGTFFENREPILLLLPVLGYIVFGIANVIFLSMAMATKALPASTVFGVWMGLALIGSLVIDVLFFKESFNILQIVFTCLIIIGVIGLKTLSEQ